jgi:transglutaminase-like putative cysteine protease
MVRSRGAALLTFVILLIMLLSVAGSIVAAGWMPGLDAVLIVVALSLLAGAALSYSHFPDWAAHLTSLIYGGFTIVVIGANRPDLARIDDWRERLFLMADKIGAWVREAVNNGTSRETLIFVLILCALFWLLGYTAAWYSFRYRRIWHVILPAGVTLFSNVSYYQGETSMAPFMIAYLLCAVLLLVLSHLEEREEGWILDRIRFPTTLRNGFIVTGVCIAALAGLFGWRLGVASASPTARDLFNQLSSPYNELLARWNRLFASLNNNVNREIDNYNSSFTLGGPRHLTPDPVMDVIAAPARYYWRAVSYDQYDGASWRNTIETSTAIQPNDNSIPLYNYANRISTPAEFSLYRGTDSVYTPSQPQQSSVGARAIFDRVSEDAVELLQLKLPVALLLGNRYAAVGSVTTANVRQLRGALTDYPDWVASKYLQVPPAVPARVIDLAREITRDSASPFDAAVAIERWLRDNIVYDEQLEAPPPGIEASDYVLFHTRRAYCNYYATAMAMMLRSLSIPARVAAGYAQGEPQIDPVDGSRALYRVKASDSHMWVEVFFPDYGWVEFEPTAGQPPLERFDPRPQAQATPTSQPQAQPQAQPPTPTPQPAETLATPTPEPPPAAPTEAPPTEPPSLAERISDVLNQLRNSVIPYLLLIPLLLALGWAGLNFVERAGFAKLPGVERAYAMVSRYAGWLGIGRDRQHTPHEQAKELAQRAPQAGEPVKRITDLYVEKRFSPPERDKGARSTADAESAWKAARGWLRRAWLSARFLKR